MPKTPLAARKGRLPLFLTAAFALLLVRWPGQAAQGASTALQQCVTTVIPSLFPFLVLSSLAISLGAGEGLGRRLSPLLSRLFGISGQGVTPLLLGLVGGYPVGARAAADLRRSGRCSREEGERLLVFCNNCGPAFLLSTAGAQVLGSTAAGWLLWAGHLLGALVIGMVWPGRRQFDGSQPSHASEHPSFAAAFTAAVTAGGESVLRLSAFVVFFGTAVRLLTVSGLLALLTAPLELFLSPLGLKTADILPLLSGSLEMTQGILALSGRQPTPGTLALAAFLLGWGGLSVHCQTRSVLRDTDLRMGGYLLAKLCHGILAGIFTWLLARLLPLPGPVVAVFSPLSGTPLPTLPEAGASLIWLVLAAICLLAIKKGGKKVADGL